MKRYDSMLMMVALFGLVLASASLAQPGVEYADPYVTDEYCTTPSAWEDPDYAFNFYACGAYVYITAHQGGGSGEAYIGVNQGIDAYGLTSGHYWECDIAYTATVSVGATATAEYAAEAYAEVEDVWCDVVIDDENEKTGDYDSVTTYDLGVHLSVNYEIYPWHVFSMALARSNSSDADAEAGAHADVYNLEYH